jgi:hypothetical protein
MWDKLTDTGQGEYILRKGKVRGVVVATGSGDEQEVGTGGRDRYKGDKGETGKRKESWDSETSISVR